MLRFRMFSNLKKNPLCSGFPNFSRNWRDVKRKNYMTRIRRTEITIETHNLTIIRTIGKPFAIFCDRCQKAVTAFTPEQIALSFRISLTEVCCRIEAEQIHLTSKKRGTALICGNWLKEKTITE